MRVISGTLRGKRLAPISGIRIRPSSDLLRESVFNILGASRVLEARVLDLYAGTGSLGIEALSRGADFAVFLDNHPQSIKMVTRNIRDCLLESRCTILKRDALRGIGFLEKSDQVFDLVFLDPPYDKGLVEPTLQRLDSSPSFSEHGCIVVEHSARETLPEQGERIQRMDQRRYGKALVSFYENVV